MRGVAHSLLSSYLTNWKQSVTINYCSTSLNFNNWVPKGSTLGPLLFLIYISDLENSMVSNPHLFADDTCICVNAYTITRGGVEDTRFKAKDTKKSKTKDTGARVL